MELLREPNDRSAVLMILLVIGAGDKANEANVGGGETSKSGVLYPVIIIVGGDWG